MGEGLQLGNHFLATSWAEIPLGQKMFWGYLHWEDRQAKPPTAGAALWQAFVASSSSNLWEVHDFLELHGVI